MFLTMFYKKQNIVLTMPLTMLIAHPCIERAPQNVRTGGDHASHPGWWSIKVTIQLKTAENIGEQLRTSENI